MHTVIDEIDKICTPSHYRNGSDASSEGVQRDLLPIIEGSTVSTKHGNVSTNHILFIASGAFHSCKPSDLMPELQGRLPVRVTLDALTEDDLCVTPWMTWLPASAARADPAVFADRYTILTEPAHCLIKQYEALIGTEGVKLSFEEGALREVARVAAEVNRTVENIGARRLHTLVERICDEISFGASEMGDDGEFVITSAHVKEKTGDLLQDLDMSKYVL